MRILRLYWEIHKYARRLRNERRLAEQSMRAADGWADDLRSGRRKH